MIPLYRKITRPSFFSFSTSFEQPPEFKTPWHYHPEYELILILGGYGTRFMGDSIAEFNECELVLVGPNLPHFWKDAPSIKDEVKAFVIHFNEDFLGKDFFHIPESIAIKQLLEKSRYGLKFKRSFSNSVIDPIHKLFSISGFDRVLILLDILNNMAKAEEYDLLSSSGFVQFFTKNNSEKINIVFEYSMTHFKSSINLELLADLVSMNKASFCRFFKKSTGKTYFDFLREIRIGYACKLLQEGDMGITQIGYECGYENISNFNRQFRIQTNTTPYTYRQRLRAG